MPDYVLPPRICDPVMQHPTLTLAEKAAWYGVRACQGNADFTPEVGTQYLSERAGVPRETLSRALRPLWDAGMLRWTGGRDSRSRRRHYTCYLPGQAPAGDGWEGSGEEPDGPIGAPECDERSHKSVTRDHITAEECDERSHNSTGSESECDERSQSYVTRDHTSLHPYKDQSLPQSSLPPNPPAPGPHQPSLSDSGREGGRLAAGDSGPGPAASPSRSAPPSKAPPAVRAGPKPFEPPTWAEVLAYAESEQIPEAVARSWWSMQLDSGWTDAGGRPIRMWRASLTRYAANAPAAEQRAAQRRGQVAHPKPETPVGTAANPARRVRVEAERPRTDCDAEAVGSLLIALVPGYAEKVASR